MHILSNPYHPLIYVCCQCVHVSVQVYIYISQAIITFKVPLLNMYIHITITIMNMYINYNKRTNTYMYSR